MSTAHRSGNFTRFKLLLLPIRMKTQSQKRLALAGLQVSYLSYDQGHLPEVTGTEKHLLLPSTIFVAAAGFWSVTNMPPHSPQLTAFQQRHITTLIFQL